MRQRVRQADRERERESESERAREREKEREREEPGTDPPYTPHRRTPPNNTHEHLRALAGTPAMLDKVRGFQSTGTGPLGESDCSTHQVLPVTHTHTNTHTHTHTSASIGIPYSTATRTHTPSAPPCPPTHLPHTLPTHTSHTHCTDSCQTCEIWPRTKPKPYTLHPKPYTLNPEPVRLGHGLQPPCSTLTTSLASLIRHSLSCMVTSTSPSYLRLALA